MPIAPIPLTSTLVFSISLDCLSYVLPISFSPFSIAERDQRPGNKNAQTSFSMADTKQPIRTGGLILQKPSTIGLSAVYVCVCVGRVGDPGPISLFLLVHSSRGSHGDGWVHQGPVNGSFLYLREVQVMKGNGWFDWKEDGDLHRE